VTATKDIAIRSDAASPLGGELQEAVRQLDGSLALAGQLLGAVPVQLTVVDRSLTVCWVNQSFADAHGVSAREACGRSAAEFFGDLSTHAPVLRRALAGEHVQFTAALPHSHEVDVDVRPLQGAHGAVIGLCLSTGAARRSEPVVPNTDYALQQVLGSLLNYIFVLDREMKILFANHAVAGRTLEGLRGLHVGEIFPSSLQPLALATLHRVLATGQLDGFSAQIEGKEARSRHFDVTVTPVRKGAEVVALTLVGTETTEQVRAERAIATQARMIESMIEGVAVVNEAGVIEITNPAFDRMFGYGRGELIGRDMSEFASGVFGQNDGPLKPGVNSLAFEFEAQRRDGSGFAAAGLVSRFEVAGRNHSLVVLQDVSERKQLERAISLAVNREQYRIGNDLHDGLGQELTGIALMLRGVAGRLTTEYPAILPEIESITRLVSNAIENTRALARGLSPVNLERGGLKDALEGLAMNAIELYSVHVVFSHRLHAGKTLGAELANHLYRIAQEAVRNAVRHGRARTIRLHLTVTRAKVSLAITDDGIGLPEHAMDASGMGLKIMRYRARMLGGEIRFESVEPTGTRVVCECPLEPSDARPKSQQRIAKSKATAAKSR
jgi:PAS domain S-box-containing protein